jgi:hypothetical protein
MRGVTDTHSGEVILIVTSGDLRALVASLTRVGPTTIMLDVGPALPGERTLPSPGERMLRSVQIDLREGDPVVQGVGDCVRIAGSQAGLTHVADALLIFEGYNDLMQPGMHTHFEPGATGAPNGVLAPQSCALAVAGPVPDTPADRKGVAS